MPEEQKPQEFPPLEVPCEVCKGGTAIFYCHKCNDSGAMLTPFGEAMLDFPKRHFKMVRMEGGFK